MDRAAVASVEVPSRSPGGARRRGGSTEATDARNAVVQRLQRQGFTVVAPPNPLRGPTSDAAYIASTVNAGHLSLITGPAP